jgi:hypothetical protein
VVRKLTLLHILVAFDLGPHQSGHQTLGDPGADTEVQVGTVGAPEEALVVQSSQLGVEYGLVLAILSSSGSEAIAEDEHEDEGQKNCQLVIQRHFCMDDTTDRCLATIQEGEY